MLVTKNNMLFFCVIVCIQHKVCLQFICTIATGNNKLIIYISVKPEHYVLQ